MFIRIWHKSENVGREDCAAPEQYVAIRYIERFYSRRYDGDTKIRYVVSSDNDTSYVTKETFEYLKLLRDRNVYEHNPPGPGPKLNLDRI